MADTWSVTWLPAARSALVELRGEAVNDSPGGLPVPALSVLDATSVLAVLTRAMIPQLNVLRASGSGCAVWTSRVDSDGKLVGLGTSSLDDAAGIGSGDPTSAPGPTELPTIEAAQYLAAYPPPPSVASGRAWYRSPVDYSSSGADAWSEAFAGNVTTGHIYTLYTPNSYDDTGQLFELHELVASYQRALDAIASGAVTGTDMTTAMSNDALVAFWSAIQQIGASLDTLGEVPPRPPTVQVLKEAADAAAQFVGDAVAEAANVAGRVVEQATKGFFEGLGGYGVAVAVAVLAIYLALH